MVFVFSDETIGQNKTKKEVRIFLFDQLPEILDVLQEWVLIIRE